MTVKLAIVTSHPVQYQVPWFRALADVTDLTVFFCHRQDPDGQARAGFDVAFDWDVPLLEGYQHQWLRNRARRPDVSTPFGCHTPDIIPAIQRGGFDACIVCGWYLRSYVQAIGACRRSGTPVLLRGDSQLATPRSAVFRMIKYWPYRWALGRVDGHLYVGTANRDYLRHYGVSDDRLFFVPHFVDNDFFAQGARDARTNGRAAAVRLDCGAADEDTLFVFVGKLIGKKRPADFVRALAAARARGANVRGLIVGSGELGPALEAEARALHAPVFFAGFRNQTELPAFLAAADAVVLPSDGRETWGLVVNEAMACGLPALVSRAVGCAADLVEDGVTGFVFSPGDVAALANHMVTVHARLRSNKSAFQPAVATRIACYSVKRAVETTLDAVLTVIDRSRPSRQRVPVPPPRDRAARPPSVHLI
jgi:glycosyltransferase involved in cell wall biosynthesis